MATWLKAEKADVLSGFVDIFLRAVLACSLRCLFKKEIIFRICEVNLTLHSNSTALL